MNKVSGLSRPAVLLLVFIFAIVLVLLILGPLVNSPTFSRIAERTVAHFTGFSFRIGELRFEYPLDLTLSRLSLEGSAGAINFRVRVPSARFNAGLKGLINGEANKIVIQGAEVELEITGAGKKGQSKPFKIPGWVWRIRDMKILDSAVRIVSAQEDLCIQNFNTFWERGADSSSGRLRISMGESPGKGEGLVLFIDPKHILPEAGFLVLPPLDLSNLILFAGLDIPLEGTVSGTLWSLPGTPETAAFQLTLQADNLSLKNAGTGTGFRHSRISTDVSFRFVRPDDPADGIRATAQMEASAHEVTLMHVTLNPEVEPFRLCGSLSVDTGSDLGAWNLTGTDGQGTLRLCSEGTLEGAFSGRMKTNASVRVSCSDLGKLEKTMAPWVSLPKGFRMAGALTADALLSGATDSLSFRGGVKTQAFHVTLPKGDPLPVELSLSWNGTLRENRLKEFELRTERFRIADIASPGVSLHYGSQGLRWQAKAKNLPLQNVSLLLVPFLPETMKTFAWGGTLSLSGQGRLDPGKDSRLKGAFLVQLLDGRFNSGDYQQMGEGIEFRIQGTMGQSSRAPTMELVLDADLNKGEVVYGGFYGNLSLTRPRLHLKLDMNTTGSRFDLGPSTLILDGVGTFHLKGSLRGRNRDTKKRVALEIHDLQLKGLIQQVLRDGLSGIHPVFETLDASGSLDGSVNFIESKGIVALNGQVRVRDASVSYPPEGLSAENIETDLPFSLGNLSVLKELEKWTMEGATPGWIKTGNVEFKGIRIPELDIRLLLARDRAELTEPLRMRIAEGNMMIPGFFLEGLLGGKRRGRTTLEARDLSLPILTEAFFGKAIGGRLGARVEEAKLEHETWFLDGELQLRAGEGLLRVEEMDLNLPPSGDLFARCAVSAERFPLESITGGLMETPLQGTVTGSLESVEISDGRLSTRGGMEISTLGGRVTISGIHAGDLYGPDPFVLADVNIKGIDLAELTSPLEFGRISGVLDGDLKGFKLSPSFPYVLAFQADLETVKTRGVPRKINATAVKNLSRMGGSNALAAALSSGLYRYIDEYYYKKMGLHATLEDGWLELHGIPKGGQEYLILRSLRMPTVSMPIKFFTSEPKIRFRRFISDIMSLGTGG